MNIKQLIKKTLTLINFNLKSMASLEISYRILSMALLLPAISHGFKGIMKFCGFSYLTRENILKFLLNPLSILLLLLLLTVTAVFEAWHIGAILHILDHSAQEHKVTMYSAVSNCIRNSRILRQKGLPTMMLYLLFILPFMNLGTGLVGSIRIPEFIMDSILKNKIRLTLLVLVYLILIFFALRWMFSFNYMMIEKTSFSEGAKKSRNLVKGHLLQLLAVILVANLILLIGFFILFILGAIVLVFLNRIDFIATDILVSIVGICLVILMVLFSTLEIPITFSMLTVLFYERKQSLQEPVIHLPITDQNQLSKHHAKKSRWFAYGILSLVLILGVLFVRAVRHGDLNLNIENLRTMEVTAHRGASAFYPENTMAAFKGAVLQNADWIELDVQQSSDGEIFVMHDTNFSRTTGVNKGCWEMTWEEIRQLDAGSFFSEEFKGEPIPLLEDVINFARIAGIRLNIELKPTGHETDFEKTVVDIIHRTNFQNSCVITSQEYDVLEHVKAEDPSVRTVYVMAIAVGDIDQLEYADDFSIEASFITEDLVERMHKLGKSVFAWTIDTEENINRMISLNVDNIISNNVPLAKSCVAKSRNSNMFNDFLQLFLTE